VHRYLTSLQINYSRAWEGSEDRAKYSLLILFGDTHLLTVFAKANVVKVASVSEARANSFRSFLRQFANNFITRRQK
jgi:hypothetical protein